VHPAPEAERLSAFAAFTRNMAKLHNLGERAWVWDERTSFAQFVDQLPRGGDRDGISRAIERQAMLVNAKSSFAIEAGAHFGVGADLYARFSAPMREIVGVHSHKELWEITSSAEPLDADAEIALRSAVVLAANASKDRQRKVNDLVLRTLLDQIFGDDITTPLPERRVRMGTVMGVAKAKLHVELDDPPTDAKLYLADVGATLGGVWLKADEAGTELRRADTGAVVCRAGDRLGVQVVRQDKARDRWVLSIAAPR
jgi:ribonuclease R